MSNSYNFGVPQSNIGSTGQRILDRALYEARWRNHSFLTNEHLFLAFVQSDWELFTEIMHNTGLNPKTIISNIESYLNTEFKYMGQSLEVSQATSLVLKLALRHANKAERQAIEASDIFAAIFEDHQNVLVKIVRQHGIDPEVLVAKVTARVHDIKLRDESLKKSFELPPFLKHFAVNLNLLARQDKITPICGRDREIEQVLEVLCHRERPNSVMLVGEPGVGKTAIVEGLARKVEFEVGTIPFRLREAQLVNLQMNSMVAGTMLRGMFEDRMQNVIRELTERPNLILFIDEAHTLVGAGSALGAPSDAANIFKSVLARGEVKIIGATTLNEYKQFIQEDEALARRFRTIHIKEPDLNETRQILYYLRQRLERNYSIRILDEAIETAIEMSPRYMRHLHLPDKVIGWLNTASVRSEISGRLEVTSADVVGVVANNAQIPVNMVFREVSDQLKNMEDALAKRVVGQRHAIEVISQKIRMNKGHLKDNFNKPDGVFLFLGPTGVGKTELAKAIAEFLFGDEKKMVRVDMSEYQDGAVATDKLIGMPRGIVGSEQGGILTNQLKDNPYTVVLLDEVEKANPSVLNVFLQAFDEGWLTDGRGKRVYLSDAIVIMTSNLGSEHFRKLSNPLGFLAQDVSVEQVRGEVMRELERRFPAEFRNRIDDSVIFQLLTLEEVKVIAVQYFEKIKKVLKEKGKELFLDKEALEQIVIKGNSKAYGARFLKRFIDSKIKIPVNEMMQDHNSFYVVFEEGDILVKHEKGMGIDIEKYALI